MTKRGRPKKEIDQKEFEKLCGLQCTLEEMCSFFDCDNKTLEKWCVTTYKKNFSDIFAVKRGIGKISLRRAGFELAKKNPAVHIFYCKNYLGMTDKQEVVQETKLAVSDNFLDALSDSATEDWESDEDETAEDSSV